MTNEDLQEFEKLINELQKAIEVKETSREELRKFLKKNLASDFVHKFYSAFTSSPETYFMYCTSTKSLRDNRLVTICKTLKDELIEKKDLEEALEDAINIIVKS